MRKIFTIVFIFVALAGMAETFRARVIWVTDGDSVIALSSDRKWHNIRLYGIDAPEVDQPGGWDATFYLIDLVARRWVTVEVTDTDYYGRTVARLRRGKTLDVNLEMVASGHAWHYFQYARDDEALAAAETAARDAGLGLWALPAPVAPWTWRKQKREQAQQEKERQDDADPAVSHDESP